MNPGQVVVAEDEKKEQEKAESPNNDTLPSELCLFLGIAIFVGELCFGWCFGCYCSNTLSCYSWML